MAKELEGAIIRRCVLSLGQVFRREGIDGHRVVGILGGMGPEALSI